MGAGRFPALERLDLSNKPIDGRGVEQFVGALDAAGAPTLELLHLQNTCFGDAGTKALAAALADGRLGSHLRVVQLVLSQNGHAACITDEGAKALLLAAVSGGRQHLTRLKELHLNLAPITSTTNVKALVGGVSALSSICLY